MDYVCYDKAKWHFGGDFPEDLPIYQGYVHTGMFMGWLAEHDFLSEEFADEVEQIKKRERTGTQVYEDWDGVLDSNMLTAEGNAFAVYYYESVDDNNSIYIDDYGNVLGFELPTLYHVEDSWENYQKISQRIDERYVSWRAVQSN